MSPLHFLARGQRGHHIPAYPFMMQFMRHFDHKVGHSIGNIFTKMEDGAHLKVVGHPAHSAARLCVEIEWSLPSKPMAEIAPQI